MAEVTIEHVNVPDDQIHEIKGAANAQVETLPFANGDGTTSFRRIRKDDLLGSGLGFKVEDRLSSTSGVAQETSLLREEQKISFGGSKTSPRGSVSIDSSGTVTFNDAGTYYVKAVVNAGFSAGATRAVVAFAVKAGGAQVGHTVVGTIEDTWGRAIEPTNSDDILEATAGSKLNLYYTIEEITGGQAGIRPTPIATSGWADAPAAHLEVIKLGVE